MYTAFAAVYDRLMADVDYAAWAEYYQSLLQLGDVRTGKVCECACGTGSLTIALAALGYQMTGVDLSPDMLFEASQKARKAGTMIPFIKQDMRELRLHRQMDAVICTCDGLNYVPPEDVPVFFRAAWEALRPGGVLVFDVSTPYKLEHILGNHFIGDETAEIAYLWKNRWRPDKGCVDMALSVFVRQADETYVRIGEQQRQYAHSAEALMSALAGIGYQSVKLYGDRRFSPATPKEQRWHISARKAAEVG